MNNTDIVLILPLVWFCGITWWVVIVKKLVHKVEQVVLVGCEKVCVFSKEVESSGNPSFHRAIAVLLNLQVPPRAPS